LSREYVEDSGERGELLSLALRHLARHRGWRNPWWNYRRLAEAANESPSPVLVEAIDKAQARFGATEVGSPVTVGQLVAAVLPFTGLIRPTQAANATVDGPVVPKVLQVDTLAEARLILATQQVPEASAELICEALMQAAAPSVPRERIGRCALVDGEVRATTSCLEFQEYRVRAAVANLRIDGNRLSDDQYDQVCDFLLSYRDDPAPKWREVAELLGVSARQLKRPTADDTESTSASFAPIDRTSRLIEAAFNKKSQLGAWWRTASGEDRAELVAFLAEGAAADSEPASAAVVEFLASVNDETQERLDKLEFGGGRAAYSREALRRLVARMRQDRCDVHDARVREFHLPADWAPPLPTFDDPIEHPTVARVNTIVRRFLMGVTSRWGVPDAVMVEHARSGFFGPTALAEHLREVRGHTARRDKAKERLASQGIQNPSNTDVRREEQIQRQNSQCLYCGTAIGMASSELDHIVPRAGGGGNRRDNLVAVCKPCNSGKSRIPFAVWASKHPNPGVSVAEAQARVDAWQALPGETRRQRDRLVRDVKHRLTLTADDEEFGDRSLESTAYAAVQMRARIISFLRSHGGTGDDVWAFTGAVTSEARKAGGVDSLLQLRDFTKKTRFDRRHHAVDAVIMTCLHPTIAGTLRKRTDLQAEHRSTGKYPEWRDYQGAQPGDIANFQAWVPRIGALAELLKASIEQDAIPVVRPLRLSPRVGSVHADTIQPLVPASLAGPLTREEILRVTDNRLCLLLLEEAQGDDLPPDPERPARLRHSPEMSLYPSNAPYLALRHGAAQIGSSIAFARIYAWQSRDGFDYGMIRMPVGEFGRIGFNRPGVDIFNEPLPAWSQAMRTANPQLVRRIDTGEAKQIGWLALRDELELDPTELMAGGDKVSEFLRLIPETRWTVKGFFDPGKITISPSYLASEGLTEDMSEAIHIVVGAAQGGVPLAINRILSVPGAAVIRRTALGAPRWRADGLPSSWAPAEAAVATFTR